MKVIDIGMQIGRREFVLQIPSGEHVMADERFFAVRTADCTISNDRWTALEREVMTAHRWWSPEELAQTSETIYPEDLPELVLAASSELERSGT
jgi:hypothetical protein